MHTLPSVAAASYFDKHTRAHKHTFAQSLVVTGSAVAEPCRSLSQVGLVDIVPAMTEAVRGAGQPPQSLKVKIVSLAICPA
jgi:hypothetical protein